MISSAFVTTPRRFNDAPYGSRCMATVTLNDKSVAQCGRYRKVGVLCTQHHKMESVTICASMVGTDD